MFLVCGEALFDLFGTEGPSGLAFDARIGGSPFNVAVGLARLGQPAGLFTGLSTDPLGVRLAAALAAEGVATGFLKRTAHPTTLSVVDLDAAGHPAYAFYGTGAADRMIAPADLPALGADVWGIHAGSYSLVVEPVGSALLALFERERGRRLLTLDPNVRLNVEPDVDLWRARIDAFVRLADVVKVSDEDLGLLYPGRTAGEIGAQWRAAGAGLVVVTRGANGAEIFGAHGSLAVPGRRIAVVDTVGAGDTFQAAVIAALGELGIRSRADLDAAPRQSLLDIAAFAVMASGITCTRRGADLPRRAELPAGIGGSV
ncbi:carbohydrate kinase [Paralimibaculum aggregatum]|uniref:Carbohydrate kinase n=1 Tax=Paralimibaculum aggregatum TaxID=3036245 RepID=A0ABQ6LH54_9RHOB|nr:carbohydrate kinase [Limibaculum sp. NKW23]GMG82620.1 carbohydrate kinase [Limibaculum sp. NKW23]